MNLKDYAAHDSLGLARLVKNRKVTAEELLDCALQASEALNAIVRSMESEARAAIAAGVPAGPSEGVPFLLKDLNPVLRRRADRLRSRFFKGWTRDFDSEVVARWKRTGAVISAKISTPEGGSSDSTEPVPTAPPINP